MRASPVFLSTGMLSPVSMASSAEPVPLITLPSAGIFAPALIKTVSPSSCISVGTSHSPSSFTKIAVSGMSFKSESMAERVFSMRPASKNFPSETRVITTAADSK